MLFVAFTSVVLLLSGYLPAAASEPGWINQVIVTGELRERIHEMPIEHRPYRPLHFYGNTLRRLHYRGTPLPTLGEVAALPVRLIARR